MKSYDYKKYITSDIKPDIMLNIIEYELWKHLVLMKDSSINEYYFVYFEADSSKPPVNGLGAIKEISYLKIPA